MSAGIGRAAFWKLDGAAVAIGLALAAGVYFLGVAPALEARTEERFKRETLGPQEALRDQRVLALRQAGERLGATLKELEDSPLRLDPVTQINHRLVRITEMAADIGLNLDQVTPGAQSPSADAVVVALRLTGRGEFPAAVAFLARMHAEFADMAVTGFRLSGNAGASEAPGAFEFDLAWFAASEAAGGDREAGVPLR